MTSTYSDKWAKAMAHAKFIAQTYSKDRSSKIGALIFTPDGGAPIMGYNGFPRGADDNNESRHERPTKYQWTEHAERNAIYNAARAGHKLLGSSIFISGLCPCTDCARAIIQSGISTVFIEASSLDETNPRVQAWAEQWGIAKEMLLECGVRVIVINEKGHVVKIHEPVPKLV